MGFWRACLMDEDRSEKEYVSEGRVRNGIDRKIKASGGVVILSYIEECCGVDLLPGLSERASPQIKNGRSC
jgi:hypothetical protein